MAIVKDQVNAILAPYFARVAERRGLRRWMNQALRTRPELPDLLQVIMRHLLGMEVLFDYEGTVRMTRNQLYTQMAEVEPEWVLTCPHPLPGLAAVRRGDAGLPDAVPRVIENRLALDQATTLGKMVGLLQEGPRGVWGLNYDLLRQLRRESAKLQAKTVRR